jgi:Rab3 GTPase-activating protein catalytic subunit
MFIGICEGSGLRTHFNICHLKTAPHQYRHLAGLLEIFKSKLVYNEVFFPFFVELS